MPSVSGLPARAPPGLLSDCALAALVFTFLIIVTEENGTLHTTAATASVNLGVLHERLPPDISELMNTTSPAQLETISPRLSSPDILLCEEMLDKSVRNLFSGTYCELEQFNPHNADSRSGLGLGLPGLALRHLNQLNHGCWRR